MSTAARTRGAQNLLAGGRGRLRRVRLQSDPVEHLAGADEHEGRPEAAERRGDRSGRPGRILQRRHVLLQGQPSFFSPTPPPACRTSSSCSTISPTPLLSAAPSPTSWAPRGLPSRTFTVTCAMIQVQDDYMYMIVTARFAPLPAGILCEGRSRPGGDDVVRAVVQPLLRRRRLEFEERTGGRAGLSLYCLLLSLSRFLIFCCLCAAVP